MQKGFAPILIILILIAALIGTGLFGTYYYGKNQGGEVVPVPQSIITPIPDETTNWKTYENTAIKFKIKYPPGKIDGFDKPVLPSGLASDTVVYATGEETVANILFPWIPNDTFQLSIFPFTGTLDELIRLHTKDPYDKAEVIPYSDGDGFLNKVKYLKIDRRDAVWYTTTYGTTGSEGLREQNGIEVWFVGNGYGFVFDIGRHLGDKMETSPEMIERMLSTFKFTD